MSDRAPIKDSLDEREEMTLRLWIQIVRLANRLQKDVDSRFRKRFGQNLTRFDILSQLERIPGNRMTVGQLSGSLLTSTTNITRLLDRMEYDGLLERELSSTDRRSFEVCATEKGLDLFRGMASDNAERIGQAFAAMSDSEMIALEKALHTVSTE